MMLPTTTFLLNCIQIKELQRPLNCFAPFFKETDFFLVLQPPFWKKDATNEVKAINVTLQPFAKELNFRITYCAKILFVFTKIEFRRNPILLRKLKSQKIDFCKLCLKRN